jgi:hypothetical protein
MESGPATWVDAQGAFHLKVEMWSRAIGLGQQVTSGVGYPRS